jgi:hypothetical protein
MIADLWNCGIAESKFAIIEFMGVRCDRSFFCPSNEGVSVLVSEKISGFIQLEDGVAKIVAGKLVAGFFKNTLKTGPFVCECGHIPPPQVSVRIINSWLDGTLGAVQHK